MLGLVSYCAFLWWRFGEPFAFARVETAEGWSRKIDRDSILMLDYFRRWWDYSPNLVHFGLSLQGLLSIVSLGLVLPIVRRLGWGYGTYTLLVVGVPLLTSSDFIAMGRYVLMAFPAFAVGRRDPPPTLIQGRWRHRPRKRRAARRDDVSVRALDAAVSPPSPRMRVIVERSANPVVGVGGIVRHVDDLRGIVFLGAPGRLVGREMERESSIHNLPGSSAVLDRRLASHDRRHALEGEARDRVLAGPWPEVLVEGDDRNLDAIAVSADRSDRPVDQRQLELLLVAHDAEGYRR